MKPVELAPDYYHKNFLELTGYVCKQYWDLLSEQERSFAQRFHKLSPHAQKLYVRLISRKGPYFRSSKLAYPEIPSLEAAALELERARLLSMNPAISTASLLALLNKQEVLKRLEEPAWKKWRRAAVDEEVLRRNLSSDKPRLQGEELLYEVLGQANVQLFKLLFFGNLHQDLTEWVLRDLGVFRYESYTMEQQTRAFTSREQVETYLQFYACLEVMEVVLCGEASGILQLVQELPTCAVEDWVLYRRLDRTKYTLARQLERLGELEEAQSLYMDCYYPPARERRARIWVKQGQWHEALDLCRSIREAPLHESEEIFALEFGHRVAKKADVEWPSPPSYRPKTQRIALFSRDLGVEVETAKYLSEQGDCYYVENALWNSLLGLCIWDIVFAPLRGAFFHPFQRSPQGFRDPEFVKQRESLLAERWLQLRTQKALQQQVLSTFRAKRGRVNPLVFWDVMTPALLKKAVERIPWQHCLVVFQRILSDLRENRTGFPDLVLFPEQGGYELIEVKGPGDRLQKNQTRWLSYFAKHNIPHRVIRVDYTEQPSLFNG